LARYHFRNLPQDVYVSAQVERQFWLRNGNRLTARIRAPRDREKYMAVEEVLSIENIPAGDWKETIEFEKLTALHRQSALFWRTCSRTPSHHGRSTSSRLWGAASGH
jgi:transcription termination factor Rho